MKITRDSFRRILWTVLIGFVFVRIYQHNLIIGLRYERQRLAQEIGQLEKQRNELLADWYQSQDPERLHALACEAWGMSPVSVDRVIILEPDKNDIDFIGTSSSAATLQAMGVLDVIMGRTGGPHVGA